jgi:hypothetical protein
MNSVQNAAEANAIKKDEVNETKRHNRENERENAKHNRIQEGASYMSSFGSVLKGAGSINDPKWYTINESMAQYADTISFCQPMCGYLAPHAHYDKDATYEVAGVMGIGFVPTIGVNPAGVTYSVLGEVSTPAPITECARQFYAYVRYANSGHTNYDEGSMQMYLIAYDSAIYMLSYAARLVGVMNTPESTLNKFHKIGWLKAAYSQKLTVTGYETIVSHLPAFKAELNDAINRLSSYVVPDNISYYKRHAFLCNSIMADSKYAKTQYYLYYPAGYFLYHNRVSGTEVPDFERLEFVKWNISDEDGVTLLTRLMGAINHIINNLKENEIVGVISGDILKAYGDAGVMHFANIDFDYKAAPITDELTLNQLKNTILVGDVTLTFKETGQETSYKDRDITGLDICQLPDGSLYQGVVVSATEADKLSIATMKFPGIPVLPKFNLLSPILNTDLDNPKGDDILELSRNLVTFEEFGDSTTYNLAFQISNNSWGSRYWTPGSQNSTTWQLSLQHVRFLKAVGSELFTTMVLVGMNLNVQNPFAATAISYTGGSSKLTFSPETMDFMANLFSFKYCPQVTWIYPGNLGQTIMTELENYAILSEEQVATLHRIALLSEFYVTPVAFKSAKKK